MGWQALAATAGDDGAGALSAMAECAIDVAGESLRPHWTGALFWPAERLLVAADLHLEKGSFFASRGQMLPPYDSVSTLALLGEAVLRFAPRTIVLLGDSFHDPRGRERLDAAAVATIGTFARGRELIWIAGNHDPEPMPDLPGSHATELRLGPLCLRHEPTAGAGGRGEIAGHLHPVARVVGRGGGTRRRAFVSDGSRLLMPAFGAYAGGLNLRDPVIASLFPGDQARAHVIGNRRVYTVGPRRLFPDR